MYLCYCNWYVPVPDSSVLYLDCLISEFSSFQRSSLVFTWVPESGLAPSCPIFVLPSLYMSCMLFTCAVRSVPEQSTPCLNYMVGISCLFCSWVIWSLSLPKFSASSYLLCLGFLALPYVVWPYLTSLPCAWITRTVPGLSGLYLSSLLCTWIT
jgi:hypothetical protein